ncbi:HEPN domain-containing protein [Candidatus Woesearchaeota archaeon]|nr:HEPN domain-containing protein [Candidatus Woesearchaeota archaeon]
MKSEEKVILISPSVEICKSYVIKSKNCLRSAKILYKARLYENSVGEAYYAMYNAALAMLYRAGIKSLNHSATSMMIGFVFNRPDLKGKLEIAKKERIRKQYSVMDKIGLLSIVKTSEQFMLEAEDFMLECEVLIGAIQPNRLKRLRRTIESI